MEGMSLKYSKAKIKTDPDSRNSQDSRNFRVSRHSRDSPDSPKFPRNLNIYKILLTISVLFSNPLENLQQNSYKIFLSYISYICLTKKNRSKREKRGIH